MALNVTKAREVIEFHEPSSFFGWYISDTGWSGSVHHFSTEEKRAAFVAAVTQAAGFGAGDYDGEILSALIVFERFGGEHEDSMQDVYEGRYTEEQLAAANLAADAALLAAA